jgi:AraC-like DNA-binding protein
MIAAPGGGREHRISQSARAACFLGERARANDTEGLNCPTKTAPGAPAGGSTGAGRTLDVFETKGVPPEVRAAYWSNGYSSRFAPVRVAPSDREQFQADLKVGTVGAVEFACVRSSPSSVERTKAHASSVPERRLGFILTMSGTGVAAHCGRETPLEPGDIILSDNTEPMCCRFDEPTEGVTVRVKESMLEQRLPHFNDLLGVRLPASEPLTDTAAAMVRCLTASMDGGLPSEYGAAMAGYLVDVLAMSFALAHGRTASECSVAGARRAVVKNFIERNINDCELTPCMVSEALDISPRYLRKLMAQDGETASGYILRRRLEEAAKQLASALCRERTVTDIAFSCGFNSTAHFARVFKAKYDATPSEYRVMHAKALQTA